MTPHTSHTPAAQPSHNETPQASHSRRGKTKRRRVPMMIYPTKDEAAALRGLFKKNRSGHIIAAALGNPAPMARMPETTAETVGALRKILGHLGRVGGNLNQVARALNTSPTAPTVKAAADLVPVIGQELDGIRESIAAALAALPRTQRGAVR